MTIAYFRSVQQQKQQAQIRQNVSAQALVFYSSRLSTTGQRIFKSRSGVQVVGAYKGTSFTATASYSGAVGVISKVNG